MAVLLTWMDVLILGQVNSMEQVAMYNAATRVIDVAQIVNLSAGAAMFPAIAASWRESAEAARELYSQSLRFFVALSLAVTVGITVLADPLAIAIFGVAYADVATPLRWLGWTFFFTTVNGPMGPLLVAAGDRYRKFVPAIALAVVGNLVLNLVLAPHWGAVGAASAFAVTGVATFIIRQRVAVEYFQTPPRLEAFLARPTLAALVMGLGVWVLQSINIFVATGAGVVIFVGMLGLLGELKREPYRTVWLVILSVALRKRINE
jgi:O-antigen/teichoic acid export membrane protein